MVADVGPFKTFSSQLGRLCHAVVETKSKGMWPEELHFHQFDFSIRMPIQESDALIANSAPVAENISRMQTRFGHSLVEPLSREKMRAKLGIVHAKDDAEVEARDDDRWG